MFLTMAYLWALGTFVYLPGRLICSSGIQNFVSAWAKQGRRLHFKTLVKNVLLKIWKRFTGSSQFLTLGLCRNGFQATKLTLNLTIWFKS